jgi:2-C-methyl-D-erythritol 4-phosphate cytidylyltransferase/2-C-methyl-D-erythritol 4-phosphate cytidylyltransferase/2-C-methyl-D-erythritol 2,4-cyclodiphosphate synthase
MDTPFAAIVTAAGSSSRMRPAAGTPVKKEYLPLGPDFCGQKTLTVLGAAVLAFAGLREIGVIVITVPAGGEAAARAALPPELFNTAAGLPDREQAAAPPILFTGGGPTRRASVHRALSLLGPYKPAWVLIHDGARPWVSEGLIRRVMDAAVKHAAAIPLLPLLETPKEIDSQGFILRHPRRAALGLSQTPQAFAFPEILRAHERAAEQEEQNRREYTDDAEVWGEFCGPVATVPGERENRKITYQEDLR